MNDLDNKHVVAFGTHTQFKLSQIGCKMCQIEGNKNNLLCVGKYTYMGIFTILHLLFHNYSGLVYDYNQNDVMLI